MNQPKATGQFESWTPGQKIAFFIEPSDATAEAASTEKIEEMFLKIKEIMHVYGYVFDMWGSTEAMKKRIIKRWIKDKSEKELEEFLQEVEKAFPDGTKESEKE